MKTKEKFIAALVVLTLGYMIINSNIQENMKTENNYDQQH